MKVWTTVDLILFSNTNDMCFEYINAKIQKDLHNK